MKYQIASTVNVLDLGCPQFDVIGESTDKYM